MKTPRCPLCGEEFLLNGTLLKFISYQVIPINEKQGV